MNKDEYQNMLHKIKGKVIAIVYIFEGDLSEGLMHYDPWKSDVISDWMKAVQELKCMPFILDVRTFCQKALSGTLPCIDYVVNLNAGTNNLSTLGLIPSICGFLNLPCIPADTVTTVIGENKHLSNLLSKTLHTKLPKELPPSNPNGIFRPSNLGSSKNIQKGFPKELVFKDYTYQEFIKGFDMTIPIIYNPLTDSLETLPPVMYYPKSLDINWFLNQHSKEKHEGYIKRIIKLENSAKNHYLKLANEFGITTYCRIDTRVSCDTPEELNAAFYEEIKLERINFIEINPLPTIKNNINFSDSFKAIKSDSSLGQCVDLYKQNFDSPSFVGFILSCSILACIKATH